MGNPSNAIITASSPDPVQTVTIGEDELYFNIPAFSYTDSIDESCSLKYFVNFKDEGSKEIFLEG